MRILVIGINGGVAAPLVGRLLRAGHNVIGTVRSADKIAPALVQFSGIESVFAVDLADADGIASRLDQALVGPAGDLDALVVCAGVADYGTLENEPLAKFRRTLEINMVACLALYQACLQRLRRTRGRMIFLSSYAGKVAMPFLGAYQASKAALESLGDAMRQEARHSNVDVVMILPGGIATPMCDTQLFDIERDIASLSGEQAALYGHYYQSHRSALVHSSKLAPDEVAIVVEQALEAPQPETRYIVGGGANFLVDRRAKLSDREFDAFCEAIHRKVAQ